MSAGTIRRPARVEIQARLLFPRPLSRGGSRCPAMWALEAWGFSVTCFLTWCFIVRHISVPATSSSDSSKPPRSGPHLIHLILAVAAMTALPEPYAVTGHESTVYLT